MADSATLRSAIAPLRAALYDFEPVMAEAVVRDRLDGAVVRLSEPFGEGEGGEHLWRAGLAPLGRAMPDLERRDYILLAGATEAGADWIGAGGTYTGTFAAPLLDIPPTGHQAAMRFAEFFRIEDGRVVEVQAVWDLPDLMGQAGVWPLVPSLGREWHVPGPATCDGLAERPHDPAHAQASLRHVVAMLERMKRHPSEGGPEVMEMERFWHPRMSWYGPGGIGTARGIRGFRNWHQIPFLAAMPDRGSIREGTEHHAFAEGDYVAVTGWPNMVQTLEHGGWLGLPLLGRQVSLRSLDFWRLEGGLVRENWVLVDLMHLYAQVGIDPLARMREANKARYGFDPETGRAMERAA